jgi:hypothetical protein
VVGRKFQVKLQLNIDDTGSNAHMAVFPAVTPIPLFS